MTSLQIKLAIAINELGSISNAAKQLRISQPNASNYIKALEKEIGFEIFSRTRSGIIVTERGRLFLVHAKKILSEQNEIFDIKNSFDMYRLRVGAVNYLSAAEPFLKICELHRDDVEGDFGFYNVSMDEGIRELDQFNLDIVFAPARKSQLAGISNICSKKDLEIISLGSVPAVISMRRDHPAALDGRCRNIVQGSDIMKDYPYVAYRNLSRDSGSTGYNDTDFIQSKYVMYVDEVVVRLRLVASTNAFCFGISPSGGVNEKYGLVSFPVPGISLDVLCLIRKSDHDRKEITGYISLLKEELGLSY